VANRVVDNPAALRYELWTDEVLAGWIQYTRAGDVVTLVHTDVDPAFEGRGLGSVLVAGTLDDVRSRGKRIRPLCPFVAAYLRRHPEYADLIA
jgi:predicted GNAT family acetyltransferase